MTYQIAGIELVCPTCRSELIEHGDRRQLECTSCRARYPVIVGVPDLRVFPDPYISIRGDHVKGEMLASHFDQLTFAQLCELYFDVTPEVPADDVRANLSRLTGGVERAAVTLESMARSLGATPAEAAHGGTWLDVGCGTAPLVAALAQQGIRSVGVDVAFRWLVIGRKRLLELGLDVPLVAACAEALPFREGQFQVVSFQSSLEVLKAPGTALREAHRTAAPGARLVISTPNGRSLGPDPHVGVFGGAWLPWRVISIMARLQMARPPLRRLFSAGALERELAAAGWREVQVGVPGVSATQRAQFQGLARRLADFYESSREHPGLATLFRMIGPLLQATATRP